jgi:hypothetical protein
MRIKNKHKKYSQCHEETLPMPTLCPTLNVSALALKTFTIQIRNSYIHIPYKHHIQYYEPAHTHFKGYVYMVLARYLLCPSTYQDLAAHFYLCSPVEIHLFGINQLQVRSIFLI